MAGIMIRMALRRLDREFAVLEASLGGGAQMDGGRKREGRDRYGLFGE